MGQVDPFCLTRPRSRRCTSGAYVCVQRHTVVWSTDKPRSAISSSTSRRLSENRRYHRTHVTIISAANWRLRNKGARQNPIRSPYQIPRPEVATLPFLQFLQRDFHIIHVLKTPRQNLPQTTGNDLLQISRHVRHDAMPKLRPPSGVRWRRPRPRRSLCRWLEASTSSRCCYKFEVIFS